MATTSRVAINGKVDTDQTCLEIMNNLATACQSYLSWDPTQGKWRITVNQEESYGSAPVFDDSNIVGSIKFSGTGIRNVYNSVAVTYPHVDLQGDTDEIRLSIPSADRYDNELDNELNLTMEYINDPIQAQYLAGVELKQSRVETVIEFATDYTGITRTAGEIIRIHYPELNYYNKPFRILSIVEDDTDDGQLTVSITAIEYVVDVYSTAGLERDQRDKQNGITSASNNVCVIESEQEAVSQSVADSLNTTAGQDALTQDILLGGTVISIPLFQTESVGWSSSQIATVYGSGTSSGASLEAFFETYRSIKNCVIFFEAPQGDVNFTVGGSSVNLTALGLPSVVRVYSRPFNVDTGTGTGSYTLKTTRYMEWSSYFTSISLTTTQPTQFYITVDPLNTYDLSASPALVTFNSSSNYIANATGDYATISVLAFLN